MLLTGFHSAVPEPQTKRKTLAERAGEPINPPRPTSSSKLFSSQSVSRLPNTYNGGHRPFSMSSAGSFAGGGRPSSRQNGLQTAASKQNIEYSVEEGGEEVTDMGASGKRKGTPCCPTKTSDTQAYTLQHGTRTGDSKTW